MINSLLVAINSSADISETVALLKNISIPATAKAFVVCVVSPEFALVPGLNDDVRMEMEEYPAAANEEAAAHQLVGTIVASLKAIGIEAVGELLSGDPAKEIVKHAEIHNCDLIVMAHHHLSWFGRLRDPSVCNAVIERTGCPVLVVTSRPQPSRGTHAS